MNAKKLLKTLGAAALIAAVTPYRIEKDEEKDEFTCQALLWKVTNYPHPDIVDQRSTSLSIGFHPPASKTSQPCEDDFCCCTCDTEPAYCTVDVEAPAECEISTEPEIPTESEIPAEPETTPESDD